MAKKKQPRDGNGRLMKGHSGLKPKGAVSEKTRNWEEMGDFITNDLVPTYVSNLTRMMNSGDEKLQLAAMTKLENILEYFKPKLSRATLDGDMNQTLTIIRKELNGIGNRDS